MSAQLISRPDQPQPWPSPVRRRAGAVSIVGLFATLVGSSLIDPLGTNHDNAPQLRNAVGHLAAVRASGLLELLAAIFAIATIAAFAGIVRQRGSGLANAGAVVGIPGCVGMAAIGLQKLFIYALVSADAPNGRQILDRLDTAVGPLPILFFALPAALVLLAAAAFRAGIAPKTTLVLAVLMFVTYNVPVRPAELISLAFGLVAFGWIAWCFARLAEPAAAPVRHTPPVQEAYS